MTALGKVPALTTDPRSNRDLTEVVADCRALLDRSEWVALGDDYEKRFKVVRTEAHDLGIYRLGNEVAVQFESKPAVRGLRCGSVLVGISSDDELVTVEALLDKAP